MIYYELRPDARQNRGDRPPPGCDCSARGHRPLPPRPEGTGQLTKGPQAWKFARAYAGVVNVSEEAAMEQLFIPRPDVKTGGKGHKRRKTPEQTTG
jgi:hypothetical protein